MSDSFFDADRAAGTYPRKGYGWQTDEEQKEEIVRRLAANDGRPWVLDEARKFGLLTDMGCKL